MIKKYFISMAEVEAFQSLIQFTETDYNPYHGPRWHTALKSIKNSTTKSIGMACHTRKSYPNHKLLESPDDRLHLYNMQLRNSGLTASAHSPDNREYVNEGSSVIFLK